MTRVGSNLRASLGGATLTSQNLHDIMNLPGPISAPQTAAGRRGVIQTISTLPDKERVVVLSRIITHAENKFGIQVVNNMNPEDVHAAIIVAFGGWSFDGQGDELQAKYVNRYTIRSRLDVLEAALKLDSPHRAAAGFLVATSHGQSIEYHSAQDRDMAIRLLFLALEPERAAEIVRYPRLLRMVVDTFQEVRSGWFVPTEFMVMAAAADPGLYAKILVEHNIAVFSVGGNKVLSPAVQGLMFAIIASPDPAKVVASSIDAAGIRYMRDIVDAVVNYGGACAAISAASEYLAREADQKISTDLTSKLIEGVSENDSVLGLIEGKEIRTAVTSLITNLPERNRAAILQSLTDRKPPQHCFGVTEQAALAVVKKQFGLPYHIHKRIDFLDSSSMPVAAEKLLDANSIFNSFYKEFTETVQGMPERFQKRWINRLGRECVKDWHSFPRNIAEGVEGDHYEKAADRPTDFFDGVISAIYTLPKASFMGHTDKDMSVFDAFISSQMPSVTNIEDLRIIKAGISSATNGLREAARSKSSKVWEIATFNLMANLVGFVVRENSGATKFNPLRVSSACREAAKILHEHSPLVKKLMSPNPRIRGAFLARLASCLTPLPVMSGKDARVIQFRIETKLRKELGKMLRKEFPKEFDEPKGVEREIEASI